MGCGCEAWVGLRERLRAMTRNQVRAHASRIEIPNYSRVSKDDLIEAIVAKELASA